MVELFDYVHGAGNAIAMQWILPWMIAAVPSWLATVKHYAPMWPPAERDV